MTPNLEQGNFGSHQGIELGNQLLSGKELSLVSAGICVKRKWIVARDQSTDSQPDTAKVGAIFVLPMIFATRAKAVTLPPLRQGNLIRNVF
jgi:hypothetical protein